MAIHYDITNHTFQISSHKIVLDYCMHLLIENKIQYQIPNEIPKNDSICSQVKKNVG